jgi:Flp pilus assembly protein TadB
VTLVLAIGAATLFVLAAPLPRRDVRPLLRRLVQRPSRDARLALPALVDALAAALASGLSLPLAFTEVSPMLPPSLSPASRRVASLLALGARVRDATQEFLTVVPAEDIAPLVVVLEAFARSGGPVGTSLERVAALLRGRLALEEERRALTAQGRASAAVLIALAPLGVLFFCVAMPDYAAALAGEGAILLVVAAVFEIAGAFWLWQILRVTTPAGDLATFLDAVVVGVEAGLSFERALALLVERAPAFARLADARRLLADLSLGRGLAASLRGFASGPDEARVASLISASTRFGSPLAHLLVVQADALRASERHRAEATARRLPLLMLFPLAFCVLPALLIVFLGPPLVSLLR